MPRTHENIETSIWGRKLHSEAMAETSCSSCDRESKDIAYLSDRRLNEETELRPLPLAIAYGSRQTMMWLPIDVLGWNVERQGDKKHETSLLIKRKS